MLPLGRRVGIARLDGTGTVAHARRAVANNMHAQAPLGALKNWL